jgi:protein TonB
MNRLVFVSLLFYSATLTGQKIFLDEYGASVVDSSKARCYESIISGSDSKTFRKRTYAITGEKESEFDFVNSQTTEGIPYLWYFGFPDKKFIRHGISRSWHKNGKIASLGLYNNDKQDGKFQEWFDNGQLKSEKLFKDGQIEGKSLSWFENGQSQSEETFVNGKKEGKSLSWYNNGKQKSEITYASGSYNGDIITYWLNGQIKRKDHYINDKFKDGICYDSLGNEIEHTPFELMPIYKGGDKQLLADFSKRAEYPLALRNAGIEGKVVVRFAVDKNGEIVDRYILQGVNNELNLEAIRVIGTLKFSEPGMSDGEPVKVYYMVPINFFLR